MGKDTKGNGARFSHFSAIFSISRIRFCMEMARVFSRFSSILTKINFIRIYSA